MSNFIQIQTKVQTRLIDLPSSTLAEIPALVNLAMRELQTRHNFWVMQKKLDANTTSLTRILAATPSDFKEWRLQPFYTENTGFVVPMEFAKSSRQMRGKFETDDIGPPKYLLRGEPSSDAGASAIEVWPLSDGQSDYTAAPAGEYRVTVPYWRYLPTLVGDTDTNFFTNSEIGEFYLVNSATAHGFAINWDVEKVAEWSALANSKYDMLVAEDKKLWFSGQDTFTPHQGANWDRGEG